MVIETVFWDMLSYLNEHKKIVMLSLPLSEKEGPSNKHIIEGLAQSDVFTLRRYFKM